VRREKVRREKVREKGQASYGVGRNHEVDGEGLERRGLVWVLHEGRNGSKAVSTLVGVERR
jgi:hypothetical protein